MRSTTHALAAAEGGPMSAWEVLPAFLAGLVFFLIGLDAIKSSLKALASRSIRRRALAAVASAPRAVILGIVFGAVGQSATAVSFVVASLVSARLMTVQRALTVVAWANPGTALLAFLAAIDMNLATLWLIGTIGLAMRQRHIARATPLLAALLGAMLGLGLLLFGLTQLKAAAIPMQHVSWFTSISTALNASLLLGFIAGALLRLVIQSSSGIVVILIALCGEGFLGAEQALMIIHGTGFGIGLSVIFLAKGLRGEALRISYWQALINAVSGGVLAMWLLVAKFGAIPSLVALFDQLTLSVESDLAFGFLLQMLLCPVIGAMLVSRANAILTSLAPDVAEDRLATPHFLDERALDEPDVALELVTQEQLRVLEALPLLLDRARFDHGTKSGLDTTQVRRALDSLDSEIRGFLSDAIARPQTRESLATLLRASTRQQSIAELLSSVDHLSKEVATLSRDSSASILGGALIEASDVMLRTLHESFQSGDSIDVEILQSMTADRGDQMESIRKTAADADFGSPQEQATMLYAASLFERVVYLMHRLAT